jgi:hypothetical protein
VGAAAPPGAAPAAPIPVDEAGASDESEASEASEASPPELRALREREGTLRLRQTRQQQLVAHIALLEQEERQRQVCSNAAVYILRADAATGAFGEQIIAALFGRLDQKTPTFSGRMLQTVPNAS